MVVQPRIVPLLLSLLVLLAIGASCARPSGQQEAPTEPVETPVTIPMPTETESPAEVLSLIEQLSKEQKEQLLKAMEDPVKNAEISAEILWLMERFPKEEVIEVLINAVSKKTSESILTSVQKIFLDELVRYHNGSVPLDYYPRGVISSALCCVEQNPIFSRLSPQGCDLLIHAMSDFDLQTVHKYHLLFFASILQCQCFFYNVGSVRIEVYGILRNNKLDPEEWAIYKDRMSYLINTNEKKKFIVDISNLTNIISDLESQVLYLRQASFGPDMLVSSCNQESWHPTRGGIAGFVDYFTGNTTDDLQTLKHSMQEDEKFHRLLFPLVENLDYDSTYFTVVQQAENFEVWKGKSNCYGRADIEVKALRSVGGAAFMFEAFYNCGHETCGYWSPMLGENVSSYCTHFESGYMASDKAMLKGAPSYKNIFCPMYSGICNPTHDKLLAQDIHMFSIYIPSLEFPRGKAIYLSPVPHPQPWGSGRVLRDQVFLTND